MKHILRLLLTLVVFGAGLWVGNHSWHLNLPSGWADTTTAVATVIGVLVTVLAVVIAVLAIISQRQSARAQHTIEFLSDALRDADLIYAKAVFAEKASQPGGLAKYAHKEHGKVESNICTVLNHFELISLGIQCGTIDYDVFKKWNRSTVLYIWTAASPFISESRKLKNSPLLWHEFEELARDFSANKNPPRKIKNPLRLLL